MFHRIKTLAPLVLTAALSLTALPASAESCFADYKAKKDNPLRLHYGVISLNDGCSKASAKAEISARIAADGWVLLTVLSVFDQSQLEGKKASAGPFHLRY